METSTPRNPTRLADSIQVMECPLCDELVMAPRSNLEVGGRLDCDHCGRESTVSLEPGHAWRAPRWTLSSGRRDRIRGDS